MIFSYKCKYKGFSAASAIFIASLTVSYQSIKAAMANLADSLRYE